MQRVLPFATAQVVATKQQLRELDWTPPNWATAKKAAGSIYTTSDASDVRRRPLAGVSPASASVAHVLDTMYAQLCACSTASVTTLPATAEGVCAAGRARWSSRSFSGDARYSGSGSRLRAPSQPTLMTKHLKSQAVALAARRAMPVLDLRRAAVIMRTCDQAF